MRLVKALTIMHRVGVGGYTLLTKAPYKAADDPTAREDIDHGDFFSHSQWIFMDRQDIAQKHDAALRCGTGQDRAYDIDRGHHTKRVVVMLVNHHPIKAGFRAVLEFFEVHAVKLLSFFRAEVGVGKHQVVITEAPGFLLRISCIPHLDEEVDFLNHVGPPVRECAATMRTAATMQEVPWHVNGAGNCVFRLSLSL